MHDKIAESLLMLDAFVSVGVKRFNLVQTKLNRGRVKNGYRPGRNVPAMKLILAEWIPRVWELHHNLIVRPWDVAGRSLAQLDDIDAGKLERVCPVAFLCVETSPGNYQAWLSIREAPMDFVSRLVIGIESDSRANCSGRVAGSPNCKPAYEPNFPTVRIHSWNFAFVVKPSDVEDLGLVATVAPPPPRPLSMRSFAGSRGWPDYPRCLVGASLKKNGEHDRSLADFMWSKWALERGHFPANVMAKLLEVSQKARDEWDRGNKDYLRRTIDAAERAMR